MKDLLSKLSGSPEAKDNSHEAKLEVLKELRDMAMEMMGERVRGKLSPMQEVSVAAPDKKGLQKGLDLASELMDKGPESEDDELEEASEHEAEQPGDLEHEEEEDPELSPDDIDAKIRELEAKKAALKSRI